MDFLAKLNACSNGDKTILRNREFWNLTRQLTLSFTFRHWTINVTTNE